MSWTITIPIPTPSLNEIQGWHWRHVAREKEVMAWALASGLAHLPKIPEAQGPRRLTIIRHGRGRLDADNLAGGCKALIDALRYRHLILDDNPRDCQLEFQQVVSRSACPHTVLILDEVA